MTGEPNRASSYTVRKLAALSGVSVRTLHHYDELGLLKPASIGANGYRYYGREQLLRLQQILFHKDMGLSLEEIRRVLDDPAFDRAAALRRQRQWVADEAARLQQLAQTIDQTLAELEGGPPIGEQAMYRGLDPDAQARQEAWVIERYGEWGRLGIEARKKVLRGWSPADHQRQAAEWSAIMCDFRAALADGAGAESERAQAIVRRLYACASHASPAPVQRGGFLNMSEIYAENPDARAWLERQASGLADYVSAVMRLFAAAPGPWPSADPAGRKHRIAGKRRPADGSSRP